MNKKDFRYIWVIEFSEDSGRTWVASELSYGNKREAAQIAAADNRDAAYKERYRVRKYVPEKEM